jgi:hypothetical protein
MPAFQLRKPSFVPSLRLNRTCCIPQDEFIESLSANDEVAAFQRKHRVSDVVRYSHYFMFRAAARIGRSRVTEDNELDIVPDNSHIVSADPRVSRYCFTPAKMSYHCALFIVTGSQRTMNNEGQFFSILVAVRLV